jgi:O-antigen/teichoic acid export membrane protein
MIKILTNMLDLEHYGLYSKLYNYLSIFAVIADLGLYTITVRELSAHEWDKKMQEKIAANVLSLRTLSGLLIIWLALGVGYFLDGYNSREAMIGIFIVSLFTLLWLINSSLMSYLQAILKTEFSIIANTSGKLLTFGMIVFFYYNCSVFCSWNERLAYILLAWVAGNLLMTMLTWWYASKWQKIRFAWDTEYIRHILKISIPYGVALFLGVIFFKVDVILLSIMEPPDIADSIIGLYSLPMKIIEVGMMYGTVFLNSLLPVLTVAYAEHQNEKARKLIKHAFILLFGGGMIASLVLFFSAEQILTLISSREFIETSIYGHTGVDAMRIVAWVFFVYTISALFTYILIAQNEQKKMLSINLSVAVFNIIGNIIIIPYYSFIGSAYVTLASQILLFILVVYATRKNFMKTR